MVTILSYDYKIILKKWVYKVKKRTNRSIKKFKAKQIVKNIYKRKTKILIKNMLLLYNWIYLRYYLRLLSALNIKYTNLILLSLFEI